jgi:hypothetical protein
MLAFLLASTLAAAPAPRLTSACGEGPTFQKDGRLVCDKCKDLPVFVKKHPVVGKAADLPDGFFVYAHGGYRNLLPDGLFISPTRSFEPRHIPGTERAMHFAISASGQWIVFLECEGKWPRLDADAWDKGGHALWLIRTDGSAKTRVPVTASRFKATGFLRNSPLGAEEIFYTDVDTKGQINALRVDLSGAAPVFGDKPRVVSTDPLSTGQDIHIAISGNHIFGRCAYIHDPSLIYLTIPDGGKGTATRAESWVTRGGPKFQCGHNMAQDGSVVLMNPGTTDNTIERILFLPFKEAGSPVPDDAMKFYNKEAVSINWEPAINGKYKPGLFHYHAFSNQREYIITRRHIHDKDGNPDELGIYSLHWPSNTWTLMSDPRVQAGNVEMHLWAANQKPATSLGRGEVVKYPLAPIAKAPARALPVIEVEATVLHIEAMPDPAVTVYRKVVSYVQYRVDKVLAGDYQQPEIVIGHWGIMDRKLTPAASYRVGQRQRIRCELMDPQGKHESIAREQTLDASQDLTLKPYWALAVLPAGAATQPAGPE